MMPLKRPAFQFYVNNWLGGTRTLTPEERGIYIDLLAYAWDNDGIPAADVDAAETLPHLCAVSKRKFRAIWSRLQCKFTLFADGYYRNSRLEIERENVANFSRKQAENRAKRPRKCDENATKTGRNSTELGLNSILTDEVGTTTRARGLKSDVLSLKTDLKIRKKKCVARDKPAPLPMPFQIGDALDELAKHSGGRFAITKLTDGQAVNVTRLVRENPALSTWKLAAEWLAAGGESWKVDLDVRALSSFSQWVVHSAKWAADGRPLMLKGSNGKPRMHLAPSVGPETSCNQSDILRGE